jgi:hypothetical protein
VQRRHKYFLGQDGFALKSVPAAVAEALTTAIAKQEGRERVLARKREQEEEKPRVGTRRRR